jgi:hypothetical protein
MMAGSTSKIELYLESGKKRTFAGAVEYPGWCRSGQDEQSAIQALCVFGPRYAHVLHSAQVEFQPPADASDFAVIERLEGDASTDFGAPGKIPSCDTQPLDEDEQQRLESLLLACWGTFEMAVGSASGRELRKGPRGGGRDVDKMVRHVLDAEAAYLARLGFKLKLPDDISLSGSIIQIRQTYLGALASATRGELPAEGPRGGARWPPRYYVRRSAWHVLDHAWEIEDRMLSDE